MKKILRAIPKIVYNKKNKLRLAIIASILNCVLIVLYWINGIWDPNQIIILFGQFLVLFTVGLLPPIIIYIIVFLPVMLTPTVFYQYSVWKKLKNKPINIFYGLFLYILPCILILLLSIGWSTLNKNTFTLKGEDYHAKISFNEGYGFMSPEFWSIKIINEYGKTVYNLDLKENFNMADERSILYSVWDGENNLWVYSTYYPGNIFVFTCINDEWVKIKWGSKNKGKATNLDLFPPDKLYIRQVIKSYNVE